MIPLERTQLYNRDSHPNRYWALPRNETQWELQITEVTRAGNALSKLLLPLLPRELVGARIGVTLPCCRSALADHIFAGLFD